MEKFQSERTCEGCPFLDYEEDTKSNFLEIIHASCSYYKTRATGYPLDSTSELAHEKIAKQLYDRTVANFAVKASYRALFRSRNNKNRMCTVGEEAKINYSS